MISCTTSKTIPSCDDYRGACDSTLRSYNTQDATLRTIANHLEFQSIDGFDVYSPNILYLSNGFGDAGCWSKRFLKVNVQTSDQMYGPYFQGCDDADGYEQEKREMQFLDEISSAVNINSLYWNGSSFEAKEASAYVHLRQGTEMIRAYVK